MGARSLVLTGGLTNVNGALVRIGQLSAQLRLCRSDVWERAWMYQMRLSQRSFALGPDNRRGMGWIMIVALVVRCGFHRGCCAQRADSSSTESPLVLVLSGAERTMKLHADLVHLEFPASFSEELVEVLYKLEVPKGSAPLSLAFRAVGRASCVAQAVLESRPYSAALWAVLTAALQNPSEAPPGH
eukprot:4385039-Amphidinium_carterae.2